MGARMIMYGLRQTEGPWAGLWLPRDAGKRASPECRFETPDLWQDKARAEQLSKEYWCQLVEFSVQPLVPDSLSDEPFPDTDREPSPIAEPMEDSPVSDALGEVSCGAV